LLTFALAESLFWINISKDNFLFDKLTKIFILTKHHFYDAILID